MDLLARDREVQITLLDGAAQAPNRPDNFRIGEEETRAAVERLTRDAVMTPRHGGPLERAGIQERLLGQQAVRSAAGPTSRNCRQGRTKPQWHRPMTRTRTLP